MIDWQLLHSMCELVICNNNYITFKKSKVADHYLALHNVH